MAEFQLSIVYDHEPQKLGFYCMLGFVPIWTLAAPFMLGAFCTYFIIHPESLTNLPLLFIAGLLFGLAAVTVAGFLVTGFFEDNRILITENGISFQPLFATALKRRRQRGWSELAKIFLQSSEEAETINLVFKDGGGATIDTDKLKAEDMEKLLMAVEAFARDAEKDSNLLNYQANLQNKNKGLTGLSYTELFDDELARRFHSTAFVPLEPGSTLQQGRLKIIRQMAFGGFSAIYLAQQDEVETVVLKEAVVPNSTDPALRDKAIAYLKNEAGILCSLSHPDIARVLDFFVEDDRHYLLLEHIAGQDLRQFIKQNGPQSEARVTAWAKTLSSILNYLHGQNPPVVHRDLTPDNIVLKNDGTIKLIDFGAANEFLGTATGTLIGKQAYIAPEQLRGKTNPASDLYALGGTLHFLLTGQDPVPLAVSRPKELVPEISQSLSDLVGRLTAFESRERISDVAVLQAELEKLAVP
ncbi:MAG: serine/threonine protein kinase [Candidatus Obscuribacter sp.]|nr:serine/threonine protein kinase [Candidatus Obscuribacter sp.]MBK9278793.1 serine/threonine protein kinase [Candidatus Obscuribacter sp.]